MPERYEQPPPPPDDYGPPPQQRRAPRMRSPLGPNQVPKWVSILVIIGVIMMFVGMVVINSTHPTTPEPERPPEANPGHEDYDPTSSEYEDYYEDLSEWSHDINNAKNYEASTFQIGAIIHNLGVLLIALPLLICALMLSNFDLGMRKIMLVMGIILLVVMYFTPVTWTYLGGLT